MSEDAMPKIEGRVPERLQLCFNCSYHYRQSESECPFCGANFEVVMRERRQAYADLFAALGRMAKIVGTIEPDPDAT